MALENYSEKVSVNINSSTLSHIDLLVDNGYYSNRSDFINQAVRESLIQRQSIINDIKRQHLNTLTPEKEWFIGVYWINQKYLEKLKEKGEKKHISGYGVLIFNKECSESLITATIESISVRGKVKCSEDIKHLYI